MIDHLTQRRNAAVMHIRRGQRNIAQGRHAEFPHVSLAMSHFEQPEIAPRIAAAPIHAVEPSVREDGLYLFVPIESDWTIKVDAGVALTAADAIRVEKRHAALRIAGERHLVIVKDVAVDR